MKTIYKKLLLILLLIPFGAMAQGTLTGRVLEKATGLPLPGVNVVVEGTTTGVSTDMDGRFRLTNVQKGAAVIFSYIGFADQRITYSGQADITVSMAEDTNQLQEVVVQVGYGTIKKKDASSAITTVTAENFQKGPIVGAEQLVQGRVAGLQVTSGSGEPGGGSLVRIRSGSSFIQNDPLYVIDGMLVDVGGGNNIGGRNPLSNINQNDIASMTILKDAAATAIYGSRASNGVIIITTKKGQAGDMKVTYNGNFQVYEVAKYLDVLSADQQRAFVNEYGSESQIALLGTSNTDWQKEIYRTATGTDHNVALSGGKDNIAYRASVGYTDMNGLLRYDNFKRVTLAASIIGNFWDNHVRLELNNKSALTYNNYSERGAIGAAATFDPTQPVFTGNPDVNGGFFQWMNPTTGLYENNANRNPVSLLQQKENLGRSNRSIGNAQLDYKIHGFEALKLTANLGYDYIDGRTWGGTDANYVVPAEAGSTYENFENKKNILMDLYANFNKRVESIKSDIDVTAGYSYQMFTNTSRGSSYNAANNTTFTNVPWYGRINLQSFFGRATWTIADKYILNGSFRADGSSRFTKENRWGYFSAASVAYRISNENFLKDSKVVSDLKLRASWGQTGQQDTAAFYPSYPLYSLSNSQATYPLGYDAAGSPIYYSTYRPLSYNSDLVWEKTETINVGADFGFFNNRVTGTLDLYRRVTDDLIVLAPNPQGVNFANQAYYNIGSLENKGLELSLDVYPIKNDEMTWRIGGNMTVQNSNLTKLIPSPAGVTNQTAINGATGTYILNYQVGYWPNAFYVYEQAYGADGRPIDGVYVDRNQDGLINSEDLYRYHKPQADIFYGFNTDFSYKNWWFSMSWRGSKGNYVYNNVASSNGNLATLPGNGNYLINPHVSVLDTYFDQPRYLSDYYVQDASFIKWDNVTLGYTFKDVFSKGSTLRLTGAVQNVLVITDYDGIDPEISNGIDNNFYPRPRTYTLGMNINF